MAYKWKQRPRETDPVLAAADAAGHRAVALRRARVEADMATARLAALEAEERQGARAATVAELRAKLHKARSRREYLTDVVSQRLRYAGCDHGITRAYEEQARELGEDVRKLEAEIAKVEQLEQSIALATRTKRAPSRATLSVLVALGAAGELPTEIRLFAAGVNATAKGDFLFDAEAAKRVMANYVARGVDVQIDLEHLSTDDTSPNYDPDARGWCHLEIRRGELWAVGITWTPDGAARLTEKRQRFVSPYFGWEETSDGQRRVVELVNFALCAQPATYDAPELIAASRGAP